MNNAARVALIALTVACSACNDPQPVAQASPAPSSAAADNAPEELATTAFIGRPWKLIAAGKPLGSMIIFLPDRTLLMDSCFETYRLSKWGVVGASRIRWIEETIPVEAEITMPGNDELRLHIAGQDEAQLYVASEVPYVCPDMPR